MAIQNPQVPVFGRLGSGGANPTLNSGTITISDADHTMTFPEWTAEVLIVTSSAALTAQRSVIAPLGADPGPPTSGVGFHQFMVLNQTSGGQSILFRGSSGPGVTIPNGSAMVVLSNGAGYFATGGSGGGGVPGITVIPPSGDTTGVQDTQNIQNAITDGAFIQLIGGTYYVGGNNQSIHVNQHCMIRGLGQATLIQNEGTTNNVFTVDFFDSVYFPNDPAQNYGGQTASTLGELAYFRVIQNPTKTPTAGYLFWVGTGDPWIPGPNPVKMTRNVHIHHTRAQGLWGGLRIDNCTQSSWVTHNTWHNFVGGGAVYYSTDPGPGDNHICDNEFYGWINTGIIIGGSDTTWWVNNKLNGSNLRFTGEKGCKSIQFFGMSIETGFPLVGPQSMIDFGSSGIAPMWIMFNGGETVGFRQLFANPNHVNGFSFSLANTTLDNSNNTINEYPVGIITGGLKPVSFPVGSGGTPPPLVTQDLALFEGTLDTPVTSYTTQAGNTFAMFFNSVNAPLLNGQGAVYLAAGTPGPTPATTGQVYGTVIPASANYTVGMTFIANTDIFQVGVFLRGNPTTGENYYFGYYADADSKILLLQQATGDPWNPVPITTLPYTWPYLATHTLTLSINGSSITAAIDDVPIAGSPFTNATLSAAGRAGFQISGLSSVSGTHWYIA